jgi:thiol-disulfide isomerase/thioredoxin
MSLTLLALLACAPKAEHDALAAKVEALEKRVDDIAKAPAAAAPGAAPAPDAGKEAEAGELYGEVLELIGQNKPEEAGKKLDALLKDYGSTRTAGRAIRTKQELDVIGKEVTDVEIESWYVDGSMDLQNGTTLVVFWEVWCPHCKREVPELQATWEEYNPKGLKMVGLTKITKSATEEKVTTFIEEQKVTYPMAKEGGNGAASKMFNVSGIPAAAVVKDGKIVWRGHPGRLSNELLDTFLES